MASCELLIHLLHQPAAWASGRHSYASLASSIFHPTVPSSSIRIAVYPRRKPSGTLASIQAAPQREK